MLRLVPLKLLFFGEGDTKTDGTMRGYQYPDGHIYISRGNRTLENLLRVSSLQSGWELAKFRRDYPDELVEVDMQDGRCPYCGPRIPRSLAVDTEVLWVHYDTFRHTARIFLVRRKAFETNRELDARIVAESQPLYEVDIKINPNALAVSLDGTGLSHFPINIPSELES